MIRAIRVAALAAVAISYIVLAIASSGLAGRAGIGYVMLAATLMVHRRAA